jgi:hypothetical protein
VIRKHNLVIAYAVILITGRCSLAGSKVDELARQDAERAAERAEIVQAAIDEPLVREQASLEPSWQPGRAQGQYEPDAEAELEMRQDARARSPRLTGRTADGFEHPLLGLRVIS